MAKKSFLEKKSVVATFGIIALLAGIYFVQSYLTGNVTGNFVADYGYFSIVPLIGLLLLVCSIILIAYAVVKRE